MIVVTFDTETTGLIKPHITDIEKQPYITEMYCHKMEQFRDDNGKCFFEDIGEFDQMFSVPVPITPEITRITGITEDTLRGKPTFADRFSALAEFMTGADRLVAHNCAFDRSMLANEVLRTGRLLNFPWPREHICTVEKSLFIEQRRMSLTNLYKHFFNEEFQDAHRAKSDVIPLVRCYKHMVQEGMIV